MTRATLDRYSPGVHTSPLASPSPWPSHFDAPNAGLFWAVCRGFRFAVALHLMAVLNSGVQRSRLLQARAHCATVLDHAGTDELTHLFGSTRRPQDGKPTPRERRQQFADEGLQNRSAAAVRAYSTSNSTYGSGRTFDEYPPRHLATTARWDSCQAMCTSAHQACVVCGDQLARPADCPRLWSWPKLCGRSQRARSDACEPWQLHSRGAIECWRERRWIYLCRELPCFPRVQVQPRLQPHLQPHVEPAVPCAACSC